METKANEELLAFDLELRKKEYTFEKSITIDEYNEILEIMPADDVDIKGQPMKSVDFLEVLYTFFVED